MTLLLIGFGGGVVIGFVLCAIRAGGQFDEGYRMGMDVALPLTADEPCLWSSSSIVLTCDGSYIQRRSRWYAKPPDGDWCETSEVFARSVEGDGWRVAEVEE